MDNQIYCFGGVVFSVESPTPLGNDPRLEAFALQANASTADYIYRIVPTCERNCDFHMNRQGNLLEITLREELIGKISIGNLLSNAKGAYLLNEQKRFLLHASYILVNNEAILFTAPSGTGKSTQANYWRQARGAEIVNEDRVILSCEDGECYAHGCWAMGSAGVCVNRSAPVRAIVLLGQGNENRCFVPTPKEILRRILPQTTFDHTSLSARIGIVDLVSAMVGNVPIVAYDCIHHVSAVEELEKYI